MKRIKKILCVAIVLTIIWGMLPVSTSKIYAAETSPQIHVFNVGKAGGSIIEYNNKYILVDAGLSDVSAITSFIKDNNISKFEYVIITHYDQDHVRGLNTILGLSGGKFKIGVGNFIARAYSTDTLKRIEENSKNDVYYNFTLFLNCVATSMSSNIKFSKEDSASTIISNINKLKKSSNYNWSNMYYGQKLTISGVGGQKLVLNFLNKSTTYITETNLSKNLVRAKFSNLVNDDSLVFRADYYTTSTKVAKKALFTGDIHYYAAIDLYDKYKSQLVADFLLVPHHGILTDYDDRAWVTQFISAVNPKVAIIQNSTSHPTSSEILNLLSGAVTYEMADYSNSSYITYNMGDGSVDVY